MNFRQLGIFSSWFWRKGNTPYLWANTAMPLIASAGHDLPKRSGCQMRLHHTSLVSHLWFSGCAMLILLWCLQTPASNSSQPGAAMRPVCQLSPARGPLPPRLLPPPRALPCSSHHKRSQGAGLPKNWQQPPPPTPLCDSSNTPIFRDIFAGQRTYFKENSLLTTLRSLQNHGCHLQSKVRALLPQLPQLSWPTKLDGRRTLS